MTNASSSRTMLTLAFLAALGCQASPPSALSLDQRISHIDWLEQVITTQYPSLHCKETLGLVSTKEEFQRARAREEYAEPSLAMFYDRIRALTASLRDTHLKVRPNIAFPTVRLNIELVDTATGIHVLNVPPTSGIVPGDRVMKIDHQPIEQVVLSLMPSIPASSRLYQRRRAISHLVRRQHNYPKTSRTTWTLQRPDGSLYDTDLTYSLVGSTESHPSVLSMLAARGITRPQKPEAQMSKNRLLDWGELAQRASYHDDHGRVLQFGIATMDGQKVGILILSSFPDGEITNEQGQTLSFLEAIRAHVSQLKSNNLPMVLDLRLNGGGNGRPAFEFISAITPASSQFASTTRSFLLTPQTRKLIASSQSPWVQFLAWTQRGSTEVRAFEALQSHLDTHPSVDGNHTPLVSAQSVITADPVIGGYDQPIVATIGPDCVSTCDMLAQMLQFNQRATLIGEPANGTGNGMSSATFSRWEPLSSPDGIFSYRIPNKVVGKPLGTQSRLVSEDLLCKDALAENRPVQPNVVHPQQLIDIFGKQQALKKTITTLFPRSLP